MCILDRSDLPENQNVFPFNQNNYMRPADEMVRAIRVIPVVGSVHASSSKTMGASKYESAMIH